MASVTGAASGHDLVDHAFASPESLNNSFRDGEDDTALLLDGTTTNWATPAAPARLDFKAVDLCYAEILSLKSLEIQEKLEEASRRVLKWLQDDTLSRTPAMVQRHSAVVLLNPMLEDVDHLRFTNDVLLALSKLAKPKQALVQQMLGTFPQTQFRKVLTVLQQFITLSFYQSSSVTEGMAAATKLLALLHAANEQAGGALVNYTEFYNDAINGEDFDLKLDYRAWLLYGNRQFSFCGHPFILDPASKASVLAMSSSMEQAAEFEGAIMRHLLQFDGMNTVSPFLVLKVRRMPYLVQDTLLQIQYAKSSGLRGLKRPLKVKFANEEGVDEGGVQKEFFHLLVRELFNPDYGMFTLDLDTRLYWFRSSYLQLDNEFELIGILIGLAIYNRHTLEVSFPMVLYKKLLGIPLHLADLAELYPDQHRSMQQLLDYPGEVEDLGLYFQAEVEVGFGEMETVDLVPGGGTVPVTASNREEYVSCYVRHLLETSISRQFVPFKRGFAMLCDGDFLKYFRAEELEALVCGGRDVDMMALEAHTQYEDGFSKDHQVVRWFWDVVHQLNESKQKLLLRFITGSDRVPIKGLAHLSPPLVISGSGGEGNRLPSAHTCFNHLLLPPYKTREELQARLELAIENSEGFGLR